MLDRFAKDRFLRDNAVFFTATMTAAVLSYLFHPVLARVLDVREYGEVQTLLSLYSNLVIVIGIFASVMVNVIANTDSHDHHDAAERMRIVTVLRKLVVLIAVAEVVAVVALSGSFQRFFHFTDHRPFMVLAVMLLFTTALSARRAFLRGSRRFGELGASQIIESGSRLVFGSLLAATAFASLGAVAGIVVAQAVVLVFLFFRTREGLRSTPGVRITFDAAVRRELRFAVLILMVSASVTVLSTADVLIVKRFFNAHEAGLYSGISTIAHIVLFVSGPVAGVLIPSVKLKASREENGRLFRKAIGLKTLIGGMTMGVFILVPESVITLLMGQRFLPAAALLPKLSIVMFVLSLVSVALMYEMALRRPFAAWLGVSGVAAVLYWSWADHSTLTAIIDHFLVVTLALGAVFLGRALLQRRPPAYVAA